jgi:hypothetical protein
MLLDRSTIDKALGGSTLLVIPSLVLFYLYGSDILMFLLFPGLAAATLIAGPHGGTALEDGIAVVVCLVVNICAYTVLCLLIVWMYRWLAAARRPAKPVARR